MNRYQRKLKSIINYMPEIIPFEERKRIGIEALKLPINNNFSVITRHVNRHIWNLVKDKRIRHWCETYPHAIIASAVVDKNNTLYTWKLGEHSYESYYMHEGYQVKLKIWCVNNDKEHNEVFETLAKQWFKNFKVVDGFKGMMPY